MSTVDSTEAVRCAGQRQASCPECDTILVVEDDSALLTLIQKSLGACGYRTDGVSSGAGALQWLERRGARLMLLDYCLPDTRGEELLREMESRGVRVPFLVATGHGSETVAVEMMKRGARDYLVKGASFLRLLPTAVEQALERIEQERRLSEAEERLRRAHREMEERVQQQTAELAATKAWLNAEMEERGEAEQRVRQHQAELAHMARLNTVGELAAGLAHELRQPLTAISSFAQACRRLWQSDPQGHREDVDASLQQICEQADRAAEIVRRVWRFARKDQPAQALLNVNELARDISARVEIEARQVQVEVCFQLVEPCPPVMSDRLQIEQVLVNLIRNGLEAMRETDDARRVLSVRTAVRAGNRLEVAVEDRGIGIREEDLPRVFEPYFTTKPGGMGMGLPISRSIVEAHGGRLWVEPNPDRGVTFKFDLPIHRGGPAGEDGTDRFCRR